MISPPLAMRSFNTSMLPVSADANIALSIAGEAKLKENMVFSNEPGVYLDGKFGIRIEDTIYLEDGKAKTFMQDDKKLIIVNNGKIKKYK